MVERKRCGRCGDVKPREDFYARRKSADGLQACCRACYAARWTGPRSGRYCSICRGTGHLRGRCPLRSSRVGPCARCYGLPHRRLRRGCPTCGEAYAREVLARPELVTSVQGVWL